MDGMDGWESTPNLAPRIRKKVTVQTIVSGSLFLAFAHTRDDNSPRALFCSFSLSLICDRDASTLPAEHVHRWEARHVHCFMPPRGTRPVGRTR